MKHDFIALEKLVWAAAAHDTHVEPAVRWCTDYPRAIERALVVHDFGPLLLLLDAGEPVHPSLLPALADALRARTSKRSGRKRLLVTTEARIVADAVLYLHRSRGVGLTRAIERIAREFDVSESTVRRATKR